MKIEIKLKLVGSINSGVYSFVSSVVISFNDLSNEKLGLIVNSTVSYCGLIIATIVYTAAYDIN